MNQPLLYIKVPHLSFVEMPHAKVPIHFLHYAWPVLFGDEFSLI